MRGAESVRSAFFNNQGRFCDSVALYETTRFSPPLQASSQRAGCTHDDPYRIPLIVARLMHHRYDRDNAVHPIRQWQAVRGMGYPFVNAFVFA